MITNFFRSLQFHGATESRPETPAHGHGGAPAGSMAGRTARSVPSPVTASDLAPSELHALLDFQDRLLSSVSQLKAWHPTQGHLKKLHDCGREGELRALAVVAVSPDWQNFADEVAESVQLYRSDWEQLPGLRQQRLKDFEWTLTDPLDGPIDLLVQRQLATAVLFFNEALKAFEQGHPDQAKAHDREGRQRCDRADALIECHRHGTAEQQQALLSLSQDLSSKEGRGRFHAYLKEAPWRSPGGSVEPLIEGSPTSPHRGARPERSALTKTSAAAAAPKKAETGASSQVMKRLQRLQWMLQATGPSPQALGTPVAHPAPARNLQAGLELPGPPAPRVVHAPDPDGCLGQLLDLLTRAAPKSHEPPTGAYLSLLAHLEQSVVNAQAAHVQSQEAQEAKASLTYALGQDPLRRLLFKGPLDEVRRLYKEAVYAGRAGRPDLQAATARKCFDLATMSLQKLRQIQANVWPDAELQLHRCASFSAVVAKMQGRKTLPLINQLIQRFSALRWSFHTASTHVQANQALDKMERTLRDIRSIVASYQESTHAQPATE